ncbi:hypothetical protein BDQ17DRAFT_1391729 [Cyathus striatus]|nr:hypothetical protein BDQ17DRAFT_1391729 [Cyathus striatus]
MAGASGGALAAQVSLAGGFGFIAAGYDTPEKFRTEINIVRGHFSSHSDVVLPIGVGFLGWQLNEENSHSATLLSIALENKVQAIWLAFGNDLHKWVKFVRKYDQSTGGRTIVFAQVSSVQEALLAVNEWGVDVVVAQAGGLANGAQIAALLTLGAAGAVLGTRFLLTPESLYTDSQRHALLAATSEATVRTMAFDYARNTLGWPHGIDGRGLRNATVDEYEAKTTDTNRIVVWAGTGVGMMKDIKLAKEVVEELQQECIKCLSASSRLVNSS